MPPRAEMGFARLAGVASLAVLAAVSTFLLPGWDAELPGGALPWQIAAGVVALGGAGWVLREVAAGGRGTRARLVRAAAGIAILLALFWVAGVALLWLIWPR